MSTEYTWMENWAKIPDTPSGRANGRTHGVCVTRDHCILVFHQAENGLLKYDPEGKLIRAVGGERWLGAHGLTLIEEDGEEFLWLVDEFSCEVAKVTPDGETVMAVGRPPHPRYDQGTYKPTWAAQNPANGDIWVADGYGSHLVHRHDREGTYLGSLAGSTEAGAFREPHGIQFRHAGNGRAELWITDRANHRIQVFNGEGDFLRASGVCHSPCCFSFLGEHVLVPELFTGVKVLRADDFTLVAEVGASDRVRPHADPDAWWPPEAPKEWPDLAGTEHVKEGMFNSPHGGCFAPNGDIFVVEWIIGGRITKLISS